jgi:hypothetical protein
MSEETLLTTNPIVVDLGNRESRLIRELKKGRGDLLDEVNEIVDEVSERIKPAAEGVERVFVPVIVIVEH